LKTVIEVSYDLISSEGKDIIISKFLKLLKSVLIGHAQVPKNFAFSFD
jgi:hypothetical protein